MGDGNADQTMYVGPTRGSTDRQSLEWGDKSGAYFGHAQESTTVHSPGDSNAGVGLAFYENSGCEHLLAAWVDDPSGGNSIRGGVENLPRGCSLIHNIASGEELISSIGDETAGLGVTVGDVDGEADSVDAIFAWVDDPDGDNTIYYKVGYDVGGDPLIDSWSTTHSVPVGVGWETQGAGA